MKFRNYLENIAGVGIYPVTTLLIFFLFFSLLTIWVVRARSSHYTDITMLPLEGEALSDDIENHNS
jgi:cytochrome c oxidase cbb3-type subunit 3